MIAINKILTKSLGIANKMIVIVGREKIEKAVVEFITVAFGRVKLGSVAKGCFSVLIKNDPII